MPLQAPMGERRSETGLTSFLGLVEDKARQRRESVEKMSGYKDALMRRRRALHWSGELLQDPRRSPNQLPSETVSARVPLGGWWWCPASTAPCRLASPATSGRGGVFNRDNAPTEDTPHFLTCVAGMSLKGTCPFASSQAVIPRL